MMDAFSGEGRLDTCMHGSRGYEYPNSLIISALAFV